MIKERQLALDFKRRTRYGGTHCNPAFKLLRQIGHRFKVSLNYITRVYQKKKKKTERGDWEK